MSVLIVFYIILGQYMAGGVSRQTAVHVCGEKIRVV
jgi:hypothetical protein